MTDPRTQSMELWHKYQNAKTKKERQDALFELQELKRKNTYGEPITEIINDLDQQTQDAIETFEGEVQ